MRSTKYPGVMTYGIVISAACDLAQDKIDKVFYVTAIPIKEWLYSDKGFQVVTASPTKNCKKSLLDNLEKYELSWDVVQTLSQEEFEVVATNNINNKNDRTSAINKYIKYNRIAKEKQTHAEKLEVYQSESKSVSSFLEEMFNGGNTHYVFIPNQALSEQIPVGQGLVVDLLELDYFSIGLIEKIAGGDIDKKVLPDFEIFNYDKRFFITENEGYAYPMGKVNSPWCEYTLQHFSNCFIRIGVDNPGKNEAKSMVQTLFQKEEQT